MQVLALESSALTASCAICEEDKIICESSITSELTHSQTLMVMIENMFKNAKKNINEIAAVAVANGPGSFTGIRIGVSTAKGISKALSIPCIGISTLLGLAKNFETTNATICATMDARRNQIYNAIFKTCENKISRVCSDRAISIDDLIQEIKASNYKQPIILTGDGAKMCYSKIKEKVNVKLSPPGFRLQRAANIGFCAIDILKNETIDSNNLVIPKYLRLSQAERMRKNAKLGGI